MSRLSPAEVLGYGASFARFPRALRAFLRDQPGYDECLAAVETRLAGRDDRFLELVTEGVFEDRRSPYRALFHHAGWTVDSIALRLAERGLEGVLDELIESGVYVSFEELKGRRPIQRDGLVLHTSPRNFDNPRARGDMRLTTSGSTGLANAVYQDLDHIAEISERELVALKHFGVAAAPTVHWTYILPGSGIRYVFQRARHGIRRQRWFTPTDWGATAASSRYDPATRYMLRCLRRNGYSVESPPFVPPSTAGVVARALREELSHDGTCLFRTTVGLGVRTCQAALEDGIDLTGVVIRLASEPLTAVQREKIEESGATVMAGYGSIETGAMALGCLNPSAADEVHVLADGFAIIAHDLDLPGRDVTVPAFHVTELTRSAPKVLLNYRIDDCGALSHRACGCPFDTIGYGTHLSSIRSYGKLVSEGVTLIGTDLLPLLEEELPRRFGGSSLDYQLQERLDEAGLPRLFLAVSPRIEVVDEGDVLRFVYGRVAAGSRAGGAASTIWRGADTLIVVREDPRPGARGKIRPLWSER